MSIPDRVTRPKLERSAPVRSVLGGPKPAASPPATDSAVGEGVRLGYQVIEDYLQRGEQVARGLGVSPPAAPADPQQLAARVVQYAGDFAAAFMEFLQSSMALRPPMPGEPPGGQPAGTAGPFDIGPRDAGAGAARGEQPTAGPSSAAAPATSAAGSWPLGLTVDLQSSKPAKVTVDLKAVSLTMPLVVHDLRAVDASRPRLTEVSIMAGAGEDNVVVRLRIPDGQPAGTYSGLIVDTGANLPQGTITVSIEG